MDYVAKVKTLQRGSEQMNKITCSSLCLRVSRKDCNAFRVNDKNECELIENPEELQEYNPDCNEGIGPSIIWTVSHLKPAVCNEYVMVVGGLDESHTEIINFGDPEFQCKNQALPTIRPTEHTYGGVIKGTPVICGGQKMPYVGNGFSNLKYIECFKLKDICIKNLVSTF